MPKSVIGGSFFPALLSKMRRRRPPGRQSRTVITVIGARSGSSALAGSLGRLGCALPKNIMEADWANMKGYFEPKDLTNLHDELLKSVGSIWSDWREFPASWFSSMDAERWRRRLTEAFLDNYGDASLAVLKDPRMCRMLPLWDKVFEDLKAHSVFCFIDRNPVEVAASLRARDGSSLTQGLRYYIRNHLDAEFATRNRSRAFVSYDALLTDWRKTVGFVSKKLQVDFEISAARQSQVDNFLEHSLKHQNTSTMYYPTDHWVEMASSVHEAFKHLAADHLEHKARNKLDQLRATFNAWHEVS